MMYVISKYVMITQIATSSSSSSSPCCCCCCCCRRLWLCCCCCCCSYAPVGWNWTLADLISAIPPTVSVVPPKLKTKQSEQPPILSSDDCVPPIEHYRRSYYKNRGLDLQDFSPDVGLGGIIQNAQGMVKSMPYESL